MNTQNFVRMHDLRCDPSFFHISVFIELFPRTFATFDTFVSFDNLIRVVKLTDSLLRQITKTSFAVDENCFEISRNE